METKNLILSEFEKNRNTLISGQSLADKLGVSRNAVWKAINALKNDGYNIQCVKNSGYIFENNNDIISKEGLLQYLKHSVQIFTYKELDSTNNEAKRKIANELKNDAIIISQTQTNGRGRLGREFYSPDSGVYYTLVLSTPKEIKDCVFITTATACAVSMVLEKFCDEDVKIKWVNDIYLNEKKVSGILTEAVTDFESGMVSHLIIGIGINTNTEIFPDELKDIATGIPLKGITKNQLIAEITENIYSFFESDKKDGYIDYYKSRSLVLGKEIFYFENSQKHEALAIDIDSSGGLVINENGLIKTLASGEISLRLK